MNHKKTIVIIALTAAMMGIVSACKKETNAPAVTTVAMVAASATTVKMSFGDNINLSSLENYAAQIIPAYIGTTDDILPIWLP